MNKNMKNQNEDDQNKLMNSESSYLYSEYKNINGLVFVIWINVKDLTFEPHKINKNLYTFRQIIFDSS